MLTDRQFSTLIEFKRRLLHVRELLPINCEQTWVEEYVLKYQPELLLELKAAVGWLRLAHPQHNNQLLGLLIVELDYFTSIK